MTSALELSLFWSFGMALISASHTYYASKHYSKIRVAIPFLSTPNFISFKHGYLYSGLVGFVSFSVSYPILSLLPVLVDSSLSYFAYSFLPNLLIPLISLVFVAQVVSGSSWLKFLFEIALVFELALVLYTQLESANFALFLALASSFAPLLVGASIAWLQWRYKKRGVEWPNFPAAGYVTSVLAYEFVGLIVLSIPFVSRVV